MIRASLVLKLSGFIQAEMVRADPGMSILPMSTCPPDPEKSRAWLNRPESLRKTPSVNDPLFLFTDESRIALPDSSSKAIPRNRSEVEKGADTENRNVSLVDFSPSLTSTVIVLVPVESTIVFRRMLRSEPVPSITMFSSAMRD